MKYFLSYASKSVVFLALVCLLAPRTGAALTYSESFVAGATYSAGSPQWDNWTTFRASADTTTKTFSKLTLSGTFDSAGKVCDDPAIVKLIADALKSGTVSSFSCSSPVALTWRVGNCGSGSELSADGTICSCGAGYRVRPQIGNQNWEGVNTATCADRSSVPNQTMTVCFEESEVYSESFVSGVTYGPSSAQGINWNTFRASLDTSARSFSTVTIRGTSDSVGKTCSDPVAVKALADGLRDGVATTVSCGGSTWYTQNYWGPGSVISADMNPGNCDPRYVVRPLINNPNWGGVNTATCGAPNQDMTVEFLFCGGPAPTGTIAIGDVTVSEGGTATFTVTRSSAAPGDVTLSYTPTNGTATGGNGTASTHDYNSSTGSVSLTGSNLTATFNVPTYDDPTSGTAIAEPDETFTVKIAVTSGAGYTITDDTGQGTIQNDDALTLSIGSPSGNEGNSGTTSLSFTVSSNIPAQDALTFGWQTDGTGSATAGGDYTAVGSGSGTLGSGSTSTTVTVSVAGDTTVELSETLGASLTSVTAPASYTSATSPPQVSGTAGTGTITNDDSATISISTGSAAETDSATTTVGYTITMTNPVDTTVSFNVDTADGSAKTGDADYAAISSLSTSITAGTTAVTGSPTATINGDGRVELDEKFSIGLSSLSAGGRSVSLLTSSADATITNDDTAKLSVAVIADEDETNSGTTTLTYRVTSDAPIDTATSVTVVSSGGTATAGTDYVSASSPVVLPADDTSEDFTVTLNGDTTVELDETFDLTISAPSASGREASISIDTASATATIQNDDTAELSLVGGTVTEGTGAGPFTTSYALQSDGLVADSAISVKFSTSDGSAVSTSDYTAVSGATITLPVSSTSANVASVTIGGDADKELVEDLSISIDAGSVTPASYMTAGANGTVPVTLDTGAKTITVRNDDNVTASIDGTVAPVVSIDEGQTADYSSTPLATFTDGDGYDTTNETHTVTVTWDDTESSVAVCDSTTAPSADGCWLDWSAAPTLKVFGRHVYRDDPDPTFNGVGSGEDITINVALTDDDSSTTYLGSAAGTATTSADVTSNKPLVANVDPIPDTSVDPYDFVAGGTVTLDARTRPSGDFPTGSGPSTDVGVLDTHTYAWDLDTNYDSDFNGTDDDDVDIVNDATPTFDDADGFRDGYCSTVVQVTVTDDDGGVSTATAKARSGAPGTCDYTVPLGRDVWKMLAPACEGVTADSLGLPGVYASEWWVYEYDETIEQYAALAASDTMVANESYWLYSFFPGTLTISGSHPDATCGSGVFPQCHARILEGDPANPIQNMVGHPFFCGVDWATVRFRDGSEVYGPADADSDGVIFNSGGERLVSGVGYTWTGSSYQAFNGVTPGAEGTLLRHDGVWVGAYKSGVEILIPYQLASPLRAEPSTQTEKTASGGWHVRLAARSGDLEDLGNVFGQLATASAGRDGHDLEEKSPPAGRHLSVVFPHPEWKRAGQLAVEALPKTAPLDWSDAWATDFHALTGLAEDRWVFEVRTSEERVELLWTGPKEILARSVLIDLESGFRIPVENGRTSFAVNGSRRFEWRLLDVRPKPALD